MHQDIYKMEKAQQAAGACLFPGMQQPPSILADFTTTALCRYGEKLQSRSQAVAEDDKVPMAVLWQSEQYTTSPGGDDHISQHHEADSSIMPWLA